MRTAPKAWSVAAIGDHNGLVLQERNTAKYGVL
jgi:hypothetical protein